jgi:hypothetical protein
MALVPTFRAPISLNFFKVFFGNILITLLAKKVITLPLKKIGLHASGD